MKHFSRYALAMVFAGAAACGDDDTPGTNDPVENADNATVLATSGLSFSPATVNIVTGGDVSWVFQSVEHTVTFNAVTGAPTNIVASSNTSVTRSFPTAGVYTYRCLIHPQMTGTVRVGQ